MERIIKIDKKQENINAVIYSDLHYTPQTNMNSFIKSVDRLTINKPDYIFFIGDLVNDSKYTNKKLIELYKLIYKMAKISKLIIVLGNHDQLTKTNGQWKEYYNEQYVQELKNNGAIILQNELYTDNNINVFGTHFSGNYYEEKEPIDEFIDIIKKVNLPKTNKINILIEHSPKHTFNTETINGLDNLKNIDITLGAHYHNGCIPWYISEILPGNFGIIDPYLKLFPQNARGTKQITDNNFGIISSPINTFNNNLKFIEPFYPQVNQKLLIRKK